MFSTFMVVVNNTNNAIISFRIVPLQLPQRIAHVHDFLSVYSMYFLFVEPSNM